MTIKVWGPPKGIPLFLLKIPAYEFSHGRKKNGEREEEQKQLADLDRGEGSSHRTNHRGKITRRVSRVRVANCLTLYFTSKKTSEGRLPARKEVSGEKSRKAPSLLTADAESDKA